MTIVTPPFTVVKSLPVSDISVSKPRSIDRGFFMPSYTLIWWYNLIQWSYTGRKYYGGIFHHYDIQLRYMTVSLGHTVDLQEVTPTTAPGFCQGACSPVTSILAIFHTC